MTIAVWARSNRKIKTSSWSAKWVFLNILLILLSCFGYLWLSVQNIQLGYQVTQAMEIQKQLKEKNRALKLQWAHLTSPTYLKIQAKRLGLKPPEKKVILQR